MTGVNNHLDSADSGARYAHLRLACLAGYGGLPNIVTAMTFDLLSLPPVTIRLVHIEGHVFELWSPNSLQHAFLPGFCDPDFHGRHDCLYAPQYSNGSVRHWPFIRRAPAVPSTDRAHDAYAPLTRFWICDDLRTRRGHLDGAFLDRLSALSRELDRRMAALRENVAGDVDAWRDRPQYASEVTLATLRNIRTWDAAVDFGVAVQRSLREKEAWVAWIEERARQRKLTLEQLRAMSMPIANDDYVGVWINGMREELSLRLMAAGVPCFVVHEYPSETVERGEIVQAAEYSDFVEGTELADLLSDTNPYQRIAREYGHRLDSVFNGTDGRGLAPLARADSETRSSSLYLAGLPGRELRPPSEFDYPPRSPPQVSMPPATPARPSRDRPSELSRRTEAPAPRAPSEAAADREAPSEPIAIDNCDTRYSAPGLTYHAVHPDRVDWIVPPLLVAICQKKGSWSRWELGDVGESTAWVHRGKSQEIEALNCWYDRVEKRMLFFGRYPMPAGVLDERVFGAPVPRFPFYFYDGNRHLAKRASHWMYPSMQSPKFHEGKRMSPPTAEQLPQRFNVKREAGGEDETGKGKGKAAAVLEEEDYEDDGGMDVDEPEPFELPTSVVVLDGLERTLSAEDFRRTTADLLYRAQVCPTAIVHGQGRMWARFPSVAQGTRAFGALSDWWHNVNARFASEAEFAEAAAYAPDFWPPAAEDAVMSSPVPEAQSLAIANPGPEALPTQEPGSATPEAPLPSTSPSERSPASSPVQSPLSPRAASPAGTVSPHSTLVAMRTTESVASPPRPLIPLPRSVGRPAPPEPPTAPRAMRLETAVLLPRPSLGDRLTDPPGPPPLPLSQRVAATVPLAQRLATSAPPLAEQISEPHSNSFFVHISHNHPHPQRDRGEEPAPAKCQKLAARLGGPAQPVASSSSVTLDDAPPTSEDAVVPKKNKRGKRGGRLVKEQERIKEKRKLEREALLEQVALTGDTSLLDWLPTLEAVEDAEMEEAANSWRDDDKDIAPDAAPR
ncbi:hypothetical protein FB451DRAFT_1403230 [Mycena latifolia]|nr:hypothetical protein FB451DRAFT_1403230 [Mycena latifolia]